MENPNPIVYASAPRAGPVDPLDPNSPITADAIYDLVRDINDPEHPLTLEQLNVVPLDQITVSDLGSLVSVEFTPTVPHCSMATLIGLCIRIQLLRKLPRRFMVDVRVRPGAHVSEEAVNKQLADKERVAAAMENPNLISVVDQCLNGPPRPGIALT